MFSGIVEEIGQVIAVTTTADGSRFRIGSKTVTSDLKIGDSVSVSGICLTAVKASPDSFEVEAMHETLRRTKLGDLVLDSAVNLERALRLSDRLGGHLVSGHVDGLASVVSITQDGFSKVVVFQLDSKFNPFFIEKGSVTVDGVSLTVASVDQKTLSAPAKSKANSFFFSVALIPHTLEVTTLGKLSEGDNVNIEVDVIAKYVAKLLEPQGVPQIQYA